MPTLNVAIVSCALLLAACSTTVSGPPEIAVDRTVCSHCKMFVSEPIYAAAYQASGQEARVFDDIGCLLDALRQEPVPPIVVWVHDASSGGWMDANAAVFVASEAVRTPMGGGVIAYADPVAADTVAAQRGGTVRTWPELVARKGDVR